MAAENCTVRFAAVGQMFCGPKVTAAAAAILQ